MSAVQSYCKCSEHKNVQVNNMAEHKFDSIKALADEIGISRTTLYKRAKENDIELTGSYTDEQLNKLMSVHLKMNSEQRIEQNSEHGNGHNSGGLAGAISALSEQLTAKDEQIAELNHRLEQAQKLVDQSQQLQLKTQLQLEKTEQKLVLLEDKTDDELDPVEGKSTGSGFWTRVFGNK